MFKKMIKSCLPSKLANLASLSLQKLRGYSSIIYSQEGEDILLLRYLSGVENGFYVDVGALHPQRFSNTYLFYKRGWRGINIDAMPGSMHAFRRQRSRDINLEIPISEFANVLDYYIFNEPALNGFNKELSESRQLLAAYKLLEKKAIKSRRLDDVLEEFLPTGQVIDFMTIDVEGLDFEVLKSNNWDKFRPEFVLVEALGTNLLEILKSEVVQYMGEQQYQLIARTYNTTFFRKVS